MSKVIRDGKVAVFVSGGWGAGWSTWNSYDEDCNFDFVFGNETLVDMVESGADTQAIIDYVQPLAPDAYLGGADGLYVEWVPEGTKFVIDEYDGSETLQTMDNMYWMEA